MSFLLASLEGTSRFDYFVSGLAIALVGYLSAKMPATRIGCDPLTLEAAALLLFLGAAFFGLKRIEASLTGLGAGARKLSAGETAGALMQVFEKGVPAHNASTGEVIHPNHALDNARRAKMGADAAAAQEIMWLDRASRFYKLRNRLLIAGFVALIAARIWAAYSQ